MEETSNLYKHYTYSLGYVRVGMELGWGGFDRAKLDMLMLIRIPFSFHVFMTRALWRVCIYPAWKPIAEWPENQAM